MLLLTCAIGANADTVKEAFEGMNARFRTGINDVDERVAASGVTTMLFAVKTDGANVAVDSDVVAGIIARFSAGLKVAMVSDWVDGMTARFTCDAKGVSVSTATPGVTLNARAGA